ncbi:MAG: aldehyde dehydrogenase [Lentimicrobiaceae bacterium]|jgi:acyl-CoA reductase-like NAD-dependent aldehyde dehydrogenase|nr:aldehyde dehydrogenase [Lentimicrobiaceae bacterium]MBT3455270.1 aldehyde dehydrogenase [Lentimicrobiaceae bacterium]MBT3817730.1 aldehyde dehydrogenase [Lentimicrobiaceae bacterium]MBT4062316.1 aldehyde dehydrogenase [Lentimicrobiaceae bacterium]MBT4190110.1 aldehyde dehydrogenase [Lentimicrobiaceae bacterium]
MVNSNLKEHKVYYQQQVEYFRDGKTKPIQNRINTLRKLYNLFKENESLIHSALNKDLGKSKFESYATELGIVLDEIKYHIRNITSWSSPTRSANPITNFPATSYTTYEPLGNVFIIAPWNYPFQLLITPLIGAISAGNTAILKPSEISSNTSMVIKDIINNNFDPGLIKVFEGDKYITQDLLKFNFNHIFFTGNTEVGKIIYKSAADKMIPVTLELGGKSPCIVDSKINLKLAAKRIIWGKLINAGQTCIAPDYILVNKEVKDKLISELKLAIINFYGNDVSLSKDYPRIINESNVIRLSTLIDNTKILYGGKYNVKDCYFEPTLIDNVSINSPIMSQEIFGPILPIMTYDNIDEAIDIVQSKEKPLALYFFSNCKQKQNRILNEVSCGGVTINDTIMHFANNKLPFGGIGNSGIGKYHGKYSFLTFSNQKPVVRKKTWIDIPIRYAPFKNKLKIVKMLLG